MKGGERDRKAGGGEEREGRVREGRKGTPVCIFTFSLENNTTTNLHEHLGTVTKRNWLERIAARAHRLAVA